MKDKNRFYVWGLTVQNMGIIKVFDVRFKGEPAIIAGAPDSGKTTAITVLAQALQGGAKTPRIKNIANKDRKEFDDVSTIVALKNPETGEDIIFIYEVKPDGKQNITVMGEDKDGKRYKLKDVRSIMPAFGIDLFNLMKKNSTEDLLKLFGVEEKFKEAHDKTFHAIEMRKQYKRKLRDIDGNLNEFEKPPIDLQIPDEIISTQSIIEEISRAETHNRKIENLRAKMDAAKDEIANIKEQIERLKKRMSEAKEEYISSMKSLKTMKPIDLEALNQKAGNIDKINNYVRGEQRRKKLLRELAETKKNIKIYDKKVSECSSKEKALVSKTIPIEGFELRDDGFYLDDLPLESHGTSKQYRIFIELAKAALDAKSKRGEKTLGAIILDRAESVGREKLIEILKEAKAAGVQVICTFTDDSNDRIPGAFYLENGKEKTV